MIENALDVTFQRALSQGRGVLFPYITVGFPNPEESVELGVAALEAGADALELGIPFSDPLMDGPAIQHSQQVALEAGITPRACLEAADAISARTDKPLIFMGAYNPLLAYGLDRFCAEAADSGVAGLIVPDVPLEEQSDLQVAATAAGLHLIQMIAPTSSAARIERASRAASGFIYCISVSGVTGARASVAATARPVVERVRQQTEVPVVVGFGIASPEAAQEVARFADGVAVGSAFITLVRDTADGERSETVRRFIASLAQALDKSTPTT